MAMARTNMKMRKKDVYTLVFSAAMNCTAYDHHIVDYYIIIICNLKSFLVLSIFYYKTRRSIYQTRLRIYEELYTTRSMRCTESCRMLTIVYFSSPYFACIVHIPYAVCRTTRLSSLVYRGIDSGAYVSM